MFTLCPWHLLGLLNPKSVGFDTKFQVIAIGGSLFSRASIMTSTPSGCYGLTKSTWPRTDLSGGCWQPVALHTRSGASRRWWWWWCIHMTHTYLHKHNHPPTHTFWQNDCNICTAGITSLVPITSCTFGEPGLTMISRIERIDPLRFLAGWRKRRLNQALSIFALVVFHCEGHFLYC